MSLDSSLNKILIIDFGSQFTQLIARRIRELGVFSEIVSHKKINNREFRWSETKVFSPVTTLCSFSVYRGIYGNIDNRDPIELLGRDRMRQMVWQASEEVQSLGKGKIPVGPRCSLCHRHR